MKPEDQDTQQLLNKLRVTDWDLFAGQGQVREALQIAIDAAIQRNEPIEHILLYGPPGLGKTTLAHLIAKAMKANIRITSGPALERAGDLAAILTNLEENDILFIDEIHRMNKVVEETLYQAMEDFDLDIVVGKGSSARTLKLNLPRFTIVGATTRSSLLSSPLRDRFGVVHRLMYYTHDELEVIVINAAKTLVIPIELAAAREIARRARGTPRIALKLLKRVRDYAQVKGTGSIVLALLDDAFRVLHVDTMGLDKNDEQYLLTVIDKFGGGAVGVNTIASTMSEDIGTIEDVIEPYLMQIGFLKRTPKGRMATTRAFLHLKRKPPTEQLRL